MARNTLPYCSAILIITVKLFLAKKHYDRNKLALAKAAPK
jgi:hypothetical protein